MVFQLFFSIPCKIEVLTHESATGADIEMYGGSIETHGGYDVRNRVNSIGTGIKLYGVKYSR